MAFDATKFKTAFKSESNSSIASPAYFEAYFETLPQCLSNSVLKASTFKRVDEAFKGLRFRAQSADLPARQMVSVQRAFNGPHKLVPYSTIYSSSIIEFIETDDFKVRQLFDAWQDVIEGNQRNFVSEYYDNLISTFVVIAYNKKGKAVGKWTFYDAFPVSVNPSQLNWNQQNSFVIIPIEMSYFRWKYENIN